MPNKSDKVNPLFTINCSLPFAFWSLPGSKKWEGICQNNNQIDTLFTEELEGFIVSPYQKDSGLRIIRSDKRISYKDNFELDQITSRVDEFLPIETSEKEYLTQCAVLIEKIKQGESEKVVLSRVKKKGCSKDPKTLFLRLVDQYPEAMVFMYSFGAEIWIGASPETLLKYQNGKFMTMALAGSKDVKKERNWTDKELKEQAYVEEYIEAILRKDNISFSKTGPRDVNAGPVKHLLSEFNGKIDKGDFLGLLNKLHPTPAVCGIPLNSATKIIERLELHDRRDYTGFFGPVYSNKAHMFVNLRSAMLINRELFLYLGGGITEGSIPEDEWKETELKADTLLSVL